MTLSSRDILAFSAINGVGPSTIFKLVNSGELGSQSIRAVQRIEEAVSDTETRDRIYRFADEQLAQASRLGVEIVTPLDLIYPHIIRQFPDAPPVLYVKGDIGSLSERTIGVIGTREPTAHGDITTRRITESFCAAGYTIVSGLALGCDAIAHKECVRVGGKGVAVLAHGLHTIAPKRNAELANALLESGGALVSEFALGVEPQPRLFVQRDRTQALLSQGIVMIQSDTKGGSLHASRAAVKYNKALIVPYPTAKDRSNREPKVQANLLIAGSDSVAKCELLHCKESDLNRVFIVRGKEDYPTMITFIDRCESRSPARLL